MTINYRQSLLALILIMSVGTSFSHSHITCDRAGNENYRYYGSCAEAPTKEACEQHYFVLGGHDPGMAWQCGWGTEIAGGEWCGNITPCLYDHGIAHGGESDWKDIPLCTDGGPNGQKRREVDHCSFHRTVSGHFSCDEIYERVDNATGHWCVKENGDQGCENTLVNRHPNPSEIYQKCAI